MSWDKYNATPIDMYNDIYDIIKDVQERYKHNKETLAAIEEIEDIVVWWANTPALHKWVKE